MNEYVSRRQRPTTTLHTSSLLYPLGLVKEDRHDQRLHTLIARAVLTPGGAGISVRSNSDCNSQHRYLTINDTNLFHGPFKKNTTNANDIKRQSPYFLLVIEIDD